MMNFKKVFMTLMVVFFTFAATAAAYGIEENTKNVLKQGLLGAGTGAIASGVSGGNAGTGALIGAGTNVIGGALLDAMTAPPAASSRSSSRRAPAAPQPQYYDDEEDYGNEQEYYEEPPQESGASKVIKQGLLGAGTGALASGMSGGSAGKGALIGAGTNVIGGALLDMMTQPSQPKRVYRKPPARQQPPAAVRVQQPGDGAVGTGTSQKKIIRKYDDNGKVVSEEEIYY